MKEEKIQRQRRRVLRRQITIPDSIIGGPENPAALSCQFYELEGGEVGAEFCAGRWQQGHTGLMHGGFISSMLDEVMGRSINNSAVTKESPFVTASMTTDFRRPIETGKPMRAFGKVEKIDGRKCFVRGVIVDEADRIMAKSSGIFVTVPMAGEDGGEDYHGLPTEPVDEKDPKFL